MDESPFEPWMEAFIKDSEDDKSKIKLLRQAVPLGIDKISNCNFGEFDFGEPILKKVNPVKIIDLNKKKKTRNNVF